MQRLVIAVDPLLFATSLAEALARPDLDVVIRNGGPVDDEPADLAIVCGPRPRDVDAAAIISLPDEEDVLGMAVVRTGNLVDPVTIDTFADLQRIVDLLVSG